MDKAKLRNICGLTTSFTMMLFVVSTAFAQSEQKHFQFDDGSSHGSWIAVTDESYDRFNQTDSGLALKPIVYNEFSLSRRFGSGEVHFANASQDDDTLNQIGVSFKGLRLDAFGGHGNSTSKIRSQYSSLDPYHFHGGTNQRYNYNGFAISSEISSNTKLNFAHAEITSAALEDRVVKSIGVSSNHIDLSMMEIQRGGDRVGSVLSIATNHGDHEVALDYLKQTNGASYQSFHYGRYYKGVNYKVGIRHTENPLYIAKNENRIVFSLDFKLGKRISRFYATEEGEETEQKQKEGKKNNNYIIAGGVIGAGLAISSGSSSSDSSARFALQHEAAREVLNRINPTSVALNREHGGYVYRNADGSYGSTTPILGETASVQLPNPSTAAPPGSVTTASYHTHAGPDPRFDNENFSPTDIFTDTIFGLDGYLGTPGGAFKYFQLSTATIFTLGTIAIQ